MCLSTTVSGQGKSFMRIELACTRLPTLPPLGFFAIRASLMRPARRLPNSPPSSMPDTRKAALPASATPLAYIMARKDFAPCHLVGVAQNKRRSLFSKLSNNLPTDLKQRLRSIELQREAGHVNLDESVHLIANLCQREVGLQSAIHAQAKI